MKTRRNTSFRISNNRVGEFIIRSGSKNTLDWRTAIWFFFIFVLMEKYYSTNCPINTTTIIKTIIVAMLFIIAAIIVFASGGYWLGISIILLLLVIMVVTYFCIPRKIIVTDTDIVLYNHGFKRKIPKCDILKARSVTAKDRNGLWRKFAVEGVWGYCGIYASKIHKNLYIYASQNKNWILIETERKNYIVSPENLDIIDVINK